LDAQKERREPSRITPLKTGLLPENLFRMESGDADCLPPPSPLTGDCMPGAAGTLSSAFPLELKV
jgi:hypothetical protein